MRIVYFYQYFCTPRGSWGTRVYEFCRDWVEQGHDVTVVTSIYAKSDLIATRMVEDQVFDGIKVKVLNIQVDNRQGFFRRVWSFISFSLLSFWYSLSLPADVVIASSGPITAALPGLTAKWFRRRKFVFEVRDLWPAGAIELGIIRNPLLKRFAYWFENLCYIAADHVVCLSPGMVQDVNRRFGHGHLTSVTNAANLELFGSTAYGDLPEWFKNRKVAIYTGNIGEVNNSPLLLRTAKKLREKGRDDILILLVGEGQLRQGLQQEIDLFDLKNIMIHPQIPKTLLVHWLQSSLVSLVPLKGTPVLDTSSPNKLFESLAAGIPVIQNTKGWIKELLEGGNCGFTVDADDETDMAACLIALADDPALRFTMGKSARILAAREFDKTLLSHRMLEVLKSVVHD